MSTIEICLIVGSISLAVGIAIGDYMRTRDIINKGESGIRMLAGERLWNITLDEDLRDQ